MAVTTFIPKIWAAKLLLTLQKILVSEAGVNHDYEGDVKPGGSVVINTLSSVTVKDYNGKNIETEDATTTDVVMNIDTQKYFAVKVDDVDKAQAADGGDLLDKIMLDAAYQLADARDAANLGEMAEEAGVTVGSEDAPRVVTTGDEAKKFVRDMKTAADKANVPRDGRVLFAGPDLENALLTDTAIALAPPSTNDVIRAGYIGKLYGFEIYSTNNLPKDEESDVEIAIATHPSFTTEAFQIANMEALRDTNSFKDIIRGLDVSGRKVVKPEGVVKGYVQYTAPEEEEEEEDQGGGTGGGGQS